MKTNYTIKLKIIFLCSFLLAAGAVFSQSKTPQSIISKDAVIRKYHELDELKSMQKGELLELVAERVKVLVRIFPYVPLVKRAGISIGDLGIPEDSNNLKTMDSQREATTTYLEATQEFQKKMLPYADKDNLIAAILFYENAMKSLREFEDL